METPIKLLKMNLDSLLLLEKKEQNTILKCGLFLRNSKFYTIV